MTRAHFLTFVSLVALLVGAVALLFPRALLESKGVAVTDGVVVWTREVGVLIACQGVLAWLARHEPDSRSLRAILIASALTQLGLFPIELVALGAGTLTRLSGVVPNSIVHVVLALAFAAYAARVRVDPIR